LSHFSIISYEFSKFTKRNKKIVSFAERSLETFESLQKGPWLKGEEGREGSGRVPAREVTGGEG